MANKEIQEKLLAIGERIKEKYQKEFDTLKAPCKFDALQRSAGQGYLTDREIHNAKLYGSLQLHEMHDIIPAHSSNTNLKGL